MTRGRDANHAYVVVEDNQTALDVLTLAIGRDWIDRPAVTRRAQLDPPPDRQFHHPGDEDGYAERERSILHSIERRRAGAREAERTTGRSL